MAKLTIVLGKKIGTLRAAEGLHDDTTIFFPELHSPAPGVVAPRHPDDFVNDTIDWIIQLLCHGKNVQLWTMSENLVNAIGGAIADQKLLWKLVEVRLYADDNKSYREFAFTQEGFLSDGWPFGWFLPK